MFHRTNISEVCPPHVVLELVEKFPALNKWSALVASTSGTRRILPPSVFLGALTYLDDIARKPVAAQRFYDGITKGADLSAGAPILMLRNRILALRAGGGICNTTTCWTPTARTLTAIEAGELLFKLPIERSQGTIRRPALWDEHVKTLPKHQVLTYMRPREQSGGRSDETFKQKVAAVRSKAPNAA
jgi:hypothetical protein